jgi:hypothetical protein
MELQVVQEGDQASMFLKVFPYLIEASWAVDLAVMVTTTSPE